MVDATKKFIEAEERTIKSMIKYAVDESDLDSLDPDNAALIAEFMKTISTANEALIKNAEIMEEMRSNLIEMKIKLDKVTK